MAKQKRLASFYFFEALENCVKKEIKQIKDAAELTIETSRPSIHLSCMSHGKCLRDIIFKVRRNKLSIARGRSWEDENVVETHWEHYHFRDTKQLEDIVAGYVSAVADVMEHDSESSINGYRQLKKNGYSGRMLCLGHWEPMEVKQPAKAQKKAVPV